MRVEVVTKNLHGTTVQLDLQKFKAWLTTPVILVDEYYH